MPISGPGACVRLHVDLLGRLDARTPTGRHIRLPGRHAQALLALLVLTRRPRSREALAADLWPDAGGGSAGSLRQALWLVRQLYHGDLLEGLGHDCFAAERERLSDRFEDALAIVAERRLAAGDPTRARVVADRLLERDPLREEAHAVLIAVHGQIGSRSQVVRQDRRLRVVRERELGERPLPDTEAIYRQALDGTMRRALERAARLEATPAPKLVAVGR